MENASIDANTSRTVILYNPTTNDTERLYVDPVTEAVLIYNTANMSPTALGSCKNAKRDGNDSPTMLGYDDTSGSIECLRTDTNGNLITILVS